MTIIPVNSTKFLISSQSHLYDACVAGEWSTIQELYAQHSFLLPIAASSLDVDGWTVLHVCAAKNRPQCLRNLLAMYDGDAQQQQQLVNRQCKRGWTALHLATLYGHVDCLRVLLGTDGVDMQLTTNEGQTLHDVVHRGDVSRVKAVMGLLADEGDGGKAERRWTRGRSVRRRGSGYLHLPSAS